MNFDSKFKILKKFEKTLPSISIGLEVLEKLNKEKNQIKKKLNSKDKVIYYDFVKNSVNEYCFESFNEKLRDIYIDSVVNNKVVLYNKLYLILCNVLEKNIKKNQYTYMNGYTIHNILSKFIHGMRVHFKPDSTKFFLNDIFSMFYVPYLEVGADKFYLLIFDFVLDLWREKILAYCRDDHSIVINIDYRDYLIDLLFFSFEIMFLGETENKEFNCFDISSDNLERSLTELHSDYLSDPNDKINRNYVSDMILNLTICSSVEFISPKIGINNVFIDNIMYGLANKAKK